MTVEDHQAAGHSSPPNNGLGRGSGSSCDPVGQAPNVTIKSSQSSWMLGVDIKSDGGYVILPERAGVILCCLILPLAEATSRRGLPATGCCCG
jgi:hypothetical protein